MEREEKIIIVRMLASAVITAAAIVLKLHIIVSLLMYAAAFLVIGYDVSFKALKKLFRGDLLDEHFLMLIASVGAFCIGEYAEAVAVMLFYQLGELLQDMAVEKSKRSIKELMDVCPEAVRVKRNGAAVYLSPDEVRIGDIVEAVAGERIALDGTVVSGRADVDTKAITGEGMPASLNVGDTVASGSILLSGTLDIEVTDLYCDSTVQKMLRLVENAANGKSKNERFITRFSKYYTPAVVICALLIAVIPSLIFGQTAEWVRRGLMFLVVSCPCALVISVPLSYFSGIGAASRKGILIKSSNALETLSSVSTLVTDKTGTITKGNFKICEITPCTVPENEFVAILSAVEAHSTHPIAKAVQEEFSSNQTCLTAENVLEIAGLGITAEINGRSVAVGNFDLMKQIGVSCEEYVGCGTAVYVSADKRYIGRAVITDEIKPEAADVVLKLKKLEVKNIVMLTGDKKDSAQAVAADVGICDVRAGLLPADKVEAVKNMLSSKQKGEKLCFVGDGINDAAVLKLCDVGVAMGALGSDAAIESADVVIMDDDLKKLPKVISMAKKTKTIVYQNIIFSLAVKFGVMILGAFGLAGMWLAVFADVGVSVIAVLNALRMLVSDDKKRC